MKLFDLDDILLQPCDLTPIKSRKDVYPFNDNGFLPLMTAPMDTVVSKDNIEIFKSNKIIPIYPRTKNNRGLLSSEIFISYGLEDFENTFLSHVEDVDLYIPHYALIDIANGHMKSLYDLVKQAKKHYGENLILMVGNIASPETFELYRNLNVDYIRIGIGNGNGCLTTVQTGVGYPMGSLIKECYQLNDSSGRTKIVADGGFKKHSDIIKGLALGADYIMLGSIFNKALESAGDTEREDGQKVNQFNKDTLEIFKIDLPLYKTFRGMSTKEAQKDLGKDDLKTSEGVIRRNKVEYTLKGWTDNFESYLRSAMSYTGKVNLQQFIGNPKFNLITQNSFNRFNK